MFRLKAFQAASFANVFNTLAYILICAIFLSTTYRRFELDAQDPYKCEALMKEGQWLDSPFKNGSRKPYKNWQAPGCLTHQYKPAEIAQCTNNKSIIFAGDSTIRQVYWAVARKLNKTRAEELEHAAYKHENQKDTIAGVTLEFLWDPFLNGSRIYKELHNYQESKAGRPTEKASAAVMLLGAGAWFSRWYDLAHSLRNFQATMDNITAYTQSSTSLAATIATSGKNDVGDQVFLAPIQIPVYAGLEGVRKETIIEGEVETMNLYLEDISDSNNILWSYLGLTGHQPDALDPTGFHVLNSVADAKADILLNLRCNSKLDQTDGYPFDRTCCSNYTTPVWSQWAVVAVGIVVAVMAAWSTLTCGQQSATRNALFFGAATLAYCYVADRTQLFDKDKKHFVNSEFFLLCGITMIAGVLSIRRSGKPSKDGTYRDQPFLSRDQTEEWKGWMQFAILIYHWTGASSVLWIYQVIRLMVSSYLFMTGFGHTCFYLKKGDFSFRRVAAVLVRLNLLSCALPYVMGTDYLFYYFAPLVTFWFGVVYTTMRIYSSKNTSTVFVISKISVAAVLVTVLLETPVFDALFAVLETVFRISWDVHEWKFRLGLDRYIVFVGMLVAILFERYNSSVAAGSPPRYMTAFRYTAIVVSVFALPAAKLAYEQFETKPESNTYQPFLAAVPILAFVVLRNASATLRNFHSSIFAWLGTFSLETFTLQFHIWLAADTKGLLSLGVFRADGSLLGDRWRDFVLLTPVFFWVSWRLATATGTLTQWILKEESEEDEAKEGLLEAGALEKEATSGFMGLTARRWKCAIWPKNLKLRVLILLVGMWILNLTW